MKSKKVKEFIEGHIQLRLLSFTAADIDYCAAMAEDDMADNACRLFEQFMSGVFQGDTPKKMAQEFKQKLMEE